jgi:hypothetical protein
MKDFDKTKNCHEYCPLRKCCRYAKGEIGLDPYDCGTYYKLDDLMNEARDIAKEQKKWLEDEEDEW